MLNSPREALRSLNLTYVVLLGATALQCFLSMVFVIHSFFSIEMMASIYCIVLGSGNPKLNIILTAIYKNLNNISPTYLSTFLYYCSPAPMLCYSKIGFFSVFLITHQIFLLSESLLMLV